MAMVRIDPDTAHARFTAAADLFNELAPEEGARMRVRDGDKLYEHGLRYGGIGLAVSVTLLRANLDHLTRADHAKDWAITQNNLGNALQDQGIRTAGEAGTALLAEAVAAFRAALEVRTREDMPVENGPGPRTTSAPPSSTRAPAPGARPAPPCWPTPSPPIARQLECPHPTAGGHAGRLGQ